MTLAHFQMKLQGNQVYKGCSLTVYARRVINTHTIYLTMLLTAKVIAAVLNRDLFNLALLCLWIIWFFSPEKSNSSCQQEKSQNKMVKQISYWLSFYKKITYSLFLPTPSSPSSQVFFFLLEQMKLSFELPPRLESKYTLSLSETEKVETKRLNRLELKQLSLKQ